MVYLSGYLFVGVMLVIFKTPIRKLVDDEIQTMRKKLIARDGTVPKTKLSVYRLALSLTLVVIYPIMLVEYLKAPKDTRQSQPRPQHQQIDSRMSLLMNKTSVEEAETKHTVIIDGRPVPFGVVHARWLSLLSLMEEGDQLFEFFSPDPARSHPGGRTGIALVRDKKIVADVVDIKNGEVVWKQK